MEAVSKYWVGLLERKGSQGEAGQQQQQQKERPTAEDIAEQHLTADSEQTNIIRQ